MSGLGAWRPFCFPADFRRAQREVIRPAFEAFARGFGSLPERKGWAVWLPAALRTPDEEWTYFAGTPLAFEAVETLHFSWTPPPVTRAGRADDPGFYFLADRAAQMLVPRTRLSPLRQADGEPLSLAALEPGRIHDLLIESWRLVLAEINKVETPTSPAGGGKHA